MNAVCERFLWSVRRECLDHIVILSEVILGTSSADTHGATSTRLDLTRGSGSGLRFPLRVSEPRSPARSRPSPCSEDFTMSTAPRHESRGRAKEPTQADESYQPSITTLLVWGIARKNWRHPLGATLPGACRRTDTLSLHASGSRPGRGGVAIRAPCEVARPSKGRRERPSGRTAWHRADS